MPMAAVKVGIAQDMLRACLEKGGSVIPGQHFREELKDEGLTFPAAWQAS
jgi:predicted nicotinamide N-methyase